MTARWRILNRPIDVDLHFAINLVYTCFILHKFCESNKVDVQYEIVQEQIEKEHLFQSSSHRKCFNKWYSYNTFWGKLVCESIANYLVTQNVLQIWKNLWENVRKINCQVPKENSFLHELIFNLILRIEGPSNMTFAEFIFTNVTSKQNFTEFIIANEGLLSMRIQMAIMKYFAKFVFANQHQQQDFKKLIFGNWGKIRKNKFRKN